MEYNSKKDAVDRVIEQSDDELDKYGESYYDQLEHIGEDGVRVQIKYMAANADGQLGRKLDKIAEGEDPDDIEPPSEGTMTWAEVEAISREFERRTETKVSEEEQIGIDEFEQYANENDIAVEKVFVANPWTKRVLTDRAIEKEQNSRQQIDMEE